MTTEDSLRECFILLRDENAKTVYSKTFYEAKKRLIIEDEEDFIESISEFLLESHNFEETTAKKCAEAIYAIWEDCSCSLTAFDRKMKSLKAEFF